ncbi:unnamed protein product [Caenorhabditis brenneri]
MAEQFTPIGWSVGPDGPILHDETKEVFYAADELLTRNPHEKMKEVLPPATEEFITVVTHQIFVYYGTFAIDVKGPTVIIGDVHGKFGYMQSQLNMHWYVPHKDGAFLRKKKNLLFLGDLVDRGKESLRILYHVYILKLLYWNRVFIIRGNHEIREINEGYGFLKECLKNLGEERGMQVHGSHNMIFEFLPFIGRVCNKIMVMHGGVPHFKITKQFLEKLFKMRYIKYPKDIFKLLAKDCMWNDPDRRWKNRGQRKINFEEHISRGYLFTEQAAINFCETTETDLIVRGHEEMALGFEIFNKTSPVCTVFSAINYYDSGNTASSMFVIPTKDNTGIAEIFIFQFDPMLKKKALPDDKTVDLAAAVAGIVMLILTGGHYYVNGKSSMELTQQERDSYAEKALIVSRLINGFSTSENMNSGPFDENQLIKELFPYGDNSEGLDVTDDIDAVINMMGSECVGDNGCGVHKQMLDQIEKVAQSNDDPKLFRMLNTGLDVLNGTDIAAIKTIHNKLVNNNYPTNVIEAIAFTKKTLSEMSEFDFGASIGGYRIKLEGFKDYITDLQVYSSLLKIKDHFDDYAKMLRLISSLIPIQQFKMDLDAAQAKYQKLMSVATPEFIKNLESKLAKLADMDPESNQKKVVTAGYYNGFEDMKKVLKDNENDWLKEALNLGKDLDKLKLKLKPLEGLVQKLEPLNKVWKGVNFDSARKSIYEMQLFVSNLDSFSGIYNTLSSVQPCFKNVNIQKKFEVDLAPSIEMLEASSKQLTPLKVCIDALTTPESTNEMSSLHTSFVSLSKREELSKMAEQKGTVSLTDNLKKLEEAYKTISFDQLAKSISVIKDIDSNVITKFTSWSGNLDFSVMSTCLKSQNFKDELEKMNPKLQALGSMKPSQQQIDPVKKLTGGLKKLQLEMSKITVSTPKRGRHRRANGELVLKNHQMSAQEIGEVHTVVQKLIKVKAMKADVQALINGKAQIDAVIQNESNPNVKGKLNKLWNDNTVEALKGILIVAEDLDKAIKKREIKMINDLALTFTVAANVTVSKVDIKKLAVVLDGKVQDSKISASLNNLKSLDLKFSKHNGAKIGSVIHRVQLYFDSMFDVKRCKGESCEAPEETDPTWYIVGGVAGVSLVVGACGGLYFYKRNKGKKKKSSDSDDSNNSKDAKVRKPTGTNTSATNANKSTEKSKESAEKVNKTAPEANSFPAKAEAPTAKREVKKPDTRTPTEQLKQSNAGVTVHPLGNDFQIIKDKKGEVFLESVSSRNGLCEGKKVIEEKMKAVGRWSEEEIKKPRGPQQVITKVNVKVPKEFKKLKEDFETEAAYIRDVEHYTAHINVPQNEGHKQITVGTWTRAVHTNPMVEDDIQPSGRPLFTAETWRSGEYIPYVERYSVGKKHEIVDEPIEPKPATDTTQSTLDESVRRPKIVGSAAQLKTATSDTKTAVPEQTLLQKALAEMNAVLKC